MACILFIPAAGIINTVGCSRYVCAGGGMVFRRKAVLLVYSVLFEGLVVPFFLSWLQTVWHLNAWIIASLMMLSFFIIYFEVINSSDYIKIDENGISRQNRGQEVWSYKWSEIDELKIKGGIFVKKVYIILDEINEKSEKCFERRHFFELGRRAKEAMAIYYVLKK